MLTKNLFFNRKYLNQINLIFRIKKSDYLVFSINKYFLI